MRGKRRGSSPSFPHLLFSLGRIGKGVKKAGDKGREMIGNRKRESDGMEFFVSS